MFEFIHIARAAEEASQASGGVAGTLGLNLKLFIGQLINFGILLVIFWKWILPNITKGLQNRQDRIAKALEDAQKTEKEKREFEIWRGAEMAKARQEASAIVTKARVDSGKVKDETLKQTKEEQQKMLASAKAQIEAEKNAAMQSAKSELADLVTMAAEKVIKQKMNNKEDAELVKESLKNL